ncbi:MAG: Serine/threonine-protein kinase pkn1 [Firmicutes bacterium ADurb.Bin300]|nr:MAG: Serine/threonine-protein kinase pkn1 [Firmicutes bacterium ADurb.Bin300]
MLRYIRVLIRLMPIFMISSCLNINNPNDSNNSNDSDNSNDYDTSKGYWISGRITENGSAMAGVSVWILGSSIDTTLTTSSEGKFSISGLGNGTYTVTPTKSEYSFTPSNKNITIAKGNDLSVDFTATKNVTEFNITGRVLESGTGLAGVSIRLVCTELGKEKDVAVVTTSSTGYYSFTGLQESLYELTPSKTGYVFDPPSILIPLVMGHFTVPNIAATKFIPTTTNLTFVTIPGGTFQMGDIENAENLPNPDPKDEKPLHSVTLSGFEMSIYEITNANYAQFLNDANAAGYVKESYGGVIGKNGFMNNNEFIFLSGTYSQIPEARCWITFSNGIFSVVPGHENLPVVYVTWYGAKAYALYYGLDLPTEAEWEYACRGGRQYMYGTDDGTLSSMKANCGFASSSFIGHAVAVGSYPANPYGLYDMSGNVWEWCHDKYELYPSDSVFNPSGAQTDYSKGRILRGGSCLSFENACRSAARCYSHELYKEADGGFRVVRRPNGQHY